MDIEEIIEKAGGAEALANLTGVGTEAIRKWRQSRAIPGKHWAALLRLPGITLSDLDPQTPQEETPTMTDTCLTAPPPPSLSLTGPSSGASVSAPTPRVPPLASSASTRA